MKQIKYIKPLSFIVLILNISMSFAQQDSQYTQYMYNPQIINPAYVGARDVLSVVGLHRSQWVGVDGAPRTSTLSVNSPIGISKKIGVGVSVINDEIGPVDENYISADFGYSIDVNRKSKLNFGLKATAQLFNVDFSKLTVYDTEDSLYAQNIDNNFNPNVGVGAYYYGENFYLGLSVPNLLETEHFDVESYNTSSSFTTSQDRMNYYLLAGYVFDVTDNVLFKPATMVKVVNGAPLQVDVSANFLINEKFVLGAAYRWSAAISFLGGFQVSDSMLIGLGYDYETTEIQEYTNGSFEVMLRYELFRKYSRMLTPRFF